MFKSFLRSRPTVSIFHHPASAPSNRALELLRSAQTSGYPPGQGNAKPLEFELEVVDAKPPTSDQMQTIMSYLPSKPSLSSAFLSSHPSAAGSDSGAQMTAQTLGELAKKSPNALKWPIVVDWMGGRAAIGDVDGVKGILEAIRKDRDGEGDSS